MKAKNFIFLLVFIVLITGMCGCKKTQNEKVIAENMKSYASNKYDCEFTVENFQAAKDETYTNILTLGDGEHIFNVYQSNASEMSDDYPLVVVNRKFSDKLNGSNTYDVFVNLMFANGNNITLNYAKSNSIETIAKDYSLLKVTVVVVVEKNITDSENELFDIYNDVMAFNPKHIDFEVIQVDSISSNLNDMLKNLPAFYDSDWKKHSEIISYLSVTETDIDSSDELIKGNVINQEL